jgi:DNA-binding FadR family transcriptional regulator
MAANGVSETGRAKNGRAGRDAGLPGSAPSLFNRVYSERRSNLIVDQVRQLIRSGHLQPGDRLPSERELGEQFGVSRVVVREALRVLESTGLVVIRVGARGGAFVAIPGSSRIVEVISDLVTLSSFCPADVTEVRLALEHALIPLVCAHATDDDIAALRDVCERARKAVRTGIAPVSEFSAEFYTKVAESTHNPAVMMLIDSFHRPLAMSADGDQDRSPYLDSLSAIEREALIDAIAERDVDQAIKVVRGHVNRRRKTAGRQSAAALRA